jgi:predicted 3-demethylubiquinone-9 3-methyltransferase (glyoxalase superfamily)
LCNTGEIGLEKQIQFNGASTTCSQVYKFLATQEEAGSDACTAGKEALHKDCCMKKCDLCSNGGIPDWYAMVEVNGKSMTCLALDGIVTESRIQSGSDQCSQLLEVAAPACCYVPPTEPCNICNNGFGFNDVKSSVSVEYGGTNATCGQIFNTLFSREEQESETCSLISNDLASKCCYDQCSLCGDLQTDPALSVTHDGTKMGCGEFDSYIFSSNLIEEGSNECKAFQTEHRPTCCYDVACSLCAKGDEVYTTKEAVMVQYGGSQATCGEVANFLYEQEMSQSNVCLTAQKDIMSSCCFQQCEICDVGTSINWAATTMFNTKEQSCTDIYWTLISESVEAGTEACNGLSQVTKDCCYKAPSQQCTLCKDDNGATYNTRWNTEVTVNGMTKTCGEYNSLLATQENDSTTCSMAKEAIFNDCCFAGSDSLVEVANQLSQAEADDVPCSLCKAGQIGLDAEIVFNNKATTCEEVHTFLISGFQDISTTCKSAQAALIGDCCREPGDLLPSDKPAFGANSTVGVDGEGSVMAEGPSGEKIIPPMEFETWSRKPINASGNASLGKVCTAALAVLAFVLCMFN